MKFLPTPSSIHRATLGISRASILLYRLGTSFTVIFLTVFLFHLQEDAAIYVDGLSLYYSPMLEYIYSSFLIYFVGMLLLDMAEKATRK